ncbi:hypothetical protein PV646_28525 [Streptomyces sp. ID05-26A]|nr:hypothetical protein [Streptomyces sp. ID05-26A]
MTNPKTERPAAPYVLRIPCLDEDSAKKFLEILAEDEIDANGIEGAEVLVPWGGDPHFAMGLAELAEFQGLMADDLAPILNQITALMRDA